ncbi:hypothetical protein [uncultured Gammaproteobacteria bacterium]|nr:hypothetical protein [uncultured Gammaproteobacteria bacterium]CAC9624228.1 hypothetical protein [uncultured Gammaproteobacteria bacterium]
MATETIFNPQGDSIQEKFKSFEYVNRCYVRDKENLNKTADFLGESKEIKSAYTLSRNSLKQAHESLDDSELKQAFENGTISNEQVRDFKQSQHMLEMESKRESSLDKSHKTGKSHQI